jgi:hypothetical protein
MPTGSVGGRQAAGRRQAGGRQANPSSASLSTLYTHHFFISIYKLLLNFNLLTLRRIPKKLDFKKIRPLLD